MSLTFTAAVPVPKPQSQPLNILITGASRGIGYGLVQQYAEANNKNKIFAAVRSVDGESSKPLRTYAASHPNVRIIPLEVSDEHSIRSSVPHVTAIVDHIDILINNAGVVGENDPLKANSKHLIATFSTNTVGPLIVVQSYLPLLQLSSAPKVINVSTILGSNQYAWIFKSPFTSYGISKAGLNYLTTVLSQVLPNILFLSIHPGWVDTDMGKAAGHPPTKLEDSVQAIRYYIAEKNVQKDQGEYLDITTGKPLPY